MILTLGPFFFFLRRSYDHLGVPEDSNETFHTGPRLVPISGVEGRLAATSLIFRELYGVPNPAQHLDRIHRDLRQQLIHEARHE